MICMMFLASYLSSRKNNDHMKELRLKDLYDGNFYHVCTEGLEQTTLMNCIAYIFRNPVSAKVCKKPEDYKWSSYASCFNDNAKRTITQKVSELGFSKKRLILRTGMDLAPCPFRIDENGMITLDSFVRNDIVEKAFWNSGKSFLFHCVSAHDEYQRW